MLVGRRLRYDYVGNVSSVIRKVKIIETYSYNINFTAECLLNCKFTKACICTRLR